MVNPVSGYKVTTPYRRSGKHWRACGWHTGIDFAAPTGTKVVAARPGTVKWVNYGSAFGSKQVAVICSDGSEDFYAHMSSRVANGAKVQAGDRVGAVGNEGNSTGPHLHFERHKVKGRWSCSNMDDPMKSVNYASSKENAVAVEYHYGGKPSGTQVIKNKYVDLSQSTWNPVKKGLELAMVYLNVSNVKFEPGKTQGLLRVRAVRTATSDESSYHDYPIIGNQLITHTYFESGDGGPTKYQVKCHGGLAEVTLTTRYRKGAVVY